MSDAPERIWARENMFVNGHGTYHTRGSEHEFTEYTRADLAPSWHRIDDPDNPPPMDELLLGFEDGMIRLILWENGWAQVGATIEKGWFQPTHWMHLPPPPKEGE